MAQQQYTDYVNLKAYLNIADNDTSQDKFLQIIIKQAMGFIDRYTQRSFGWGDQGDSPFIDYSDTNNIGITSVTTSGNSAVVKFYGPTPYQVGSKATFEGFTPTSYNGNFTVTATSSDNTTVTFDMTQALSAPTVIGKVKADVSNYRNVIQESYDSILGHTFYLRNCDIRSIDALWVGLRNISQPTLLPPEQYVWRDDGRIILGGAYFNSYDSSVYTGDTNNNFWGAVASGYQTITVSYHYGYTGVPPEIELACLDICQTMYIMRQSKGIYRERIGDYDVMYQRSVLHELENRPDIMGILDMYRRKNIA